MSSPAARRAATSPLAAGLVGTVLLGGLLLTLPPVPASARPARFAIPSPGSVRPVDGPVLRAFDKPPHAYGPGHRGVDLAASGGSPVHAARSGRVYWAGPVAGLAWVTIDHGRGLRTTYGGVAARVTVGERVGAGAVIGVLDASRTHLEWGAYVVRGRDRRYVDPMLLLADLRPVLVAPGGSGPGV